MYRNTILLLVLLVCSLSAMWLTAQNEASHKVYFDWDASTLTAAEAAKITEVPLQPECRYRIEAHTDARGSDRYNASLATRRAETVAAQLVERGIDPMATKKAAFGEQKPWREGVGEPVWRWNRRVDILCDCPEREGELGERGGNLNANSFDADELRALLRPEEQVYIWYHERDTILELAAGGRLRLQAHSVAARSGMPVEIRVREYYDFRSMIGGNMMTVSVRGNLMETGGSLEVRAFQDGQEVSMKLDRSFEIDIPTDDFKSGMLSFAGVQQEGEVRWEENAFKKRVRTTYQRPIQIYPRSLAYRMWVGIFNREKYKIQKDFGRKPKVVIAKGFRPADSLQYAQLRTAEKTYYILPVKKFGFINCDRWPPRVPRTEISLALKAEKARMAFLVFPRVRGIMSSKTRSTGYLFFQHVPEKRRCKLLVVDHLGEEVRYLFQEIESKEEPVEPGNWTYIAKDELPATLASLGL